MKKALVLCMFLLISLPLVAADISDIEIIEYGIYTSETVGTIYAPLTTSGKCNLVKDITLVKKTDRMPATQGTKFGLFYLINGDLEDEEVKITEIVKFPSPDYRDMKTGKILLN
jgi:hypothetical protein